MSFASRYAAVSYVFPLLIWLVYAGLAFVTSPEAFARSGAGLILAATLLSASHLLVADQNKRFFSDPYRNGSIQDSGERPEFSVEKNEALQRVLNEVWDLNQKSQNTEVEVIGKVIRWEVGLATVGTAIWGYGDLLVEASRS